MSVPGKNPLKVSFLKILSLACFWAFSAGASTETCDHAALASAKKFGVPPQVMLAITRVETGRHDEGELRPWPWSVNNNGTSHWFADQDEAARFVIGEVEKGRTNIDLGCFQLNLRWHGMNFATVEDMLDPRENATYAARYLAEQHQKHGNWVDAVAAYHSSDPRLAEIYIQKVEAVLEELSQSGIQSSAAISQQPDEGTHNLFPLLQPGVGGSMASIVPSASLAQPLFLAVP